MSVRDTWFKDYDLAPNEVKAIEGKCKEARGRERELILMAAESVYPEIAEYIFFSLCTGRGYDNISKICDIPIGRKDFYGYRRKTIYEYNKYMILDGRRIV